MYDSDLSKDIATRIHAVPKNCYGNARTAFLRFKKLHHEGLYIEGFAVIPMGNPPTLLYFEHAWIELEDGRIVDPTFAVLKHKKNVEYLPGIKLNYEEFKTWRKEKRQFPFFYNFGFGGYNHPGFKEAHKKALIATGLSAQTYEDVEEDYSSFNISSISL